MAANSIGSTLSPNVIQVVGAIFFVLPEGDHVLHGLNIYIHQVRGALDLDDGLAGVDGSVVRVLEVEAEGEVGTTPMAA